MTAKQLAVFVIIFFIAQSALSQGATKISGRINFAENEVIEFFYREFYFSFNPYVKHTKTDKDGNFSLEVELDDNEFAYLHFPKTGTLMPLFVGKNDSLYLEADFSDPVKTASFSGSLASENQLLTLYESNFSDEENKIDNFFTIDSKKFLKNLENEVKQREAFLKANLPKKTVMPAFLTVMNARPFCELMTVALIYADESADEMKKSTLQKIKSVTENRSFNEKLLLKTFFYHDYLYAKLLYLSDDDIFTAISPKLYLKRFQSAKSVFKGDEQEHIIAKLITRAYSYGLYTTVQNEIDEFLMKSRNIKMSQSLKEELLKKIRFKIGNKFPDFELKEITQNENFSVKSCSGSFVCLAFIYGGSEDTPDFMSYLSELSAAHEDKNLLFWIIDADATNTTGEFAAENLLFPNAKFSRFEHGLFDKKFLDLSLERLPALFILDTEGRIIVDFREKDVNFGLDTEIENIFEVRKK